MPASATTTPGLSSNIQQQNGTKLRIKKFQGGTGAHTLLGGGGAHAEPSKLKMAGVASLQRERGEGATSELGLSKKHYSGG